MLALHGTGVSDGIVLGPAPVLQQLMPEVPQHLIELGQIEPEIDRFRQAVADARRQLSTIRDHIPANAPPEAAGFLDAHLLILTDPMIVDATIETIRRRRRNAAWALTVQGEELTRTFERMEDPYLRNKKVDVMHVLERILRNLLQTEEEFQGELEAGAIVVANDLTPADTLILKHQRIRAFVTNLGGPISHTAILARSLCIPAVVSVHGATRYVRQGETLIVDGKRGLLIVAPDRPTLQEYRHLRQDIAERRRELERLRRSPAVTQDRGKIRLEANIELPADVKAALAAQATGIGLYRTEFLFMNRRGSPPGEDEQFRAYVRVVKAMGRKPVTIRTIDLGADKQVDGAREAQAVAVNPALGLRAVRLCLHDTTLFIPQLRAILRASAYGNVRIMIPMLSAQEELFRVLDLLDETKSALKRAGQKFNPRIPVGGMIEVPAAAISADLFAPYLDFFSIGTNDLIQYTLAIDRVDDAVNYLYDPLHPSVLRLIRLTIDAAKKARIPVAMCGEMAGDVRYTRLLLGLGLTEFSMHPATLLAVKRIVRLSRLTSVRRSARDILAQSETRKLHALVEELNRDVLH